MLPPTQQGPQSADVDAKPWNSLANGVEFASMGRYVTGV
jgi:hypothetical protein